MNATPKLSAAQAILKAAATLPETFTEWDLSVAAWTLDRKRFEMRGYPQHPDTKRIAMEIMGRKPNNPIVLGFMERVAPNTYRVTDLGRAEVARLDGLVPDGDYKTIRGVLESPGFLHWQDTQERPPGVSRENLPALIAVFRRHAGRYVSGPPGTYPVKPAQVGEGLAFLEVLANGSRTRKAASCGL